MIFSLLNIFFDILIVVLLLRYFIDRYRYFGLGPLMSTLIRLTDLVVRPLRERLPSYSKLLREQIYLAAIGVTLVIRGLALWLFGSGYAQFSPILRFSPAYFAWIGAVTASFAMGVVLIGTVICAFLFASMMLTRSGVNLHGNGAFVCFKEKTFLVFRTAQKFIKTDNLLVLFLCSAPVILLAAGGLSAICNLSLFWGLRAFLTSVIFAVFEMILQLFQVYWFLLLLAILASWIAADQFSTILQVVRALTDPYLGLFRRWLPWARIDFVDLSPIFAFLALNPCLVTVLMMIRDAMIKSLFFAG